MVKSYKELIVWQKSIRLVKDIFEITSKFPASEIYGLVSQMRRAVVSIPSNIAEGNARGHRAEYIHFLYMAFGSATELETQLILARDLGFIEKSEFAKINAALEEILKMLNKIISQLKTPNH